VTAEDESPFVVDQNLTSDDGRLPIEIATGVSLKSIVEAALFVNEKPMSAVEIAQPLNLDRDAVEDAINALAQELCEQKRGLRVVHVGGGYQMRTSGEAADVMKAVYKDRFKRKLSGSALEVLAIIAYKQPITKTELDTIRGVDCDGVLRNLMNLGLVKIKGRKEVVGRPFMYGTSDAFLEYFGLNSLRDLPKLEIDGATVKLGSLDQIDVPADEVAMPAVSATEPVETQNLFAPVSDEPQTIADIAVTAAQFIDTEATHVEEEESHG
jgi:segregation and condensation protein B